MNPTSEQLMDKIIFRKGKDANYDGRIEDIRGFRQAMLADKKQGWWARVLRWLKRMSWKLA